MSTQSDIVNQLVDEMCQALVDEHRAHEKALEERRKQRRVKRELAEWGYSWTFKTGLVKLPEGEAKS
jgi:actin-related protein